jgi:hypothetical protein
MGARRLGAAGVAGAIVAAALAAGCETPAGSYGPPSTLAGWDADAVVARMGPPTGRHALPEGGTRLEFARGPLGRHTWMIDLDPMGRALRAEQVLTEATFAQVRDGDRREDVLRRIGRPSEVRSGGWAGGETWSWRFDDDNRCLWFEVSMKDGRARGPAYAIDPRCDPGHGDSSYN